MFAEHGFEGARTRDILERARVTAPALYHHFGSKAGLFTAVFRAVNDTVLEAFTAAAASATTIEERIDAVLLASVRLQSVAPSLPRFVAIAPLEYRRHAELSDLRQEMNRLGVFLRELCVDAADPSNTAKVLETLVYGLSRQAAAMSAAEYADHVDAVRRMVRGDLLH